MRRHLMLIGLISLTFAMESAQAFNLKWLEFSPVKYFTAEDWEMARAAARKALNETPDGERVSWRNEASGNHGSLTPVSDLIEKGRRCRDLEIRNHAKNLSGGGTYRFCQTEAGTWKVYGGKLGQ